MYVIDYVLIAYWLFHLLQVRGLLTFPKISLDIYVSNLFIFVIFPNVAYMSTL